MEEHGLKSLPELDQILALPVIFYGAFPRAGAQ